MKVKLPYIGAAGLLAAVITSTLTLNTSARADTVTVNVPISGTFSNNEYLYICGIPFFTDPGEMSWYAQEVPVNPGDTNETVTFPVTDYYTSSYRAIVVIPTNSTIVASSASTTNLTTATYNHYSGYITNGLVLEQMFAGSAADASGYGNNGTLEGGPSYITITDTNTPITTALELSAASDQYANDGSSSSLSINGDITMSAWINVNSFPASNSYAYIIDDGDNGFGEGYYLRWFNDGSSIYLQAESWNGGAPTGLNDSSVHYDTGEWYFLTVVVTNNNWNLYVNGVSTTIQGSTREAFSDTGELTIGAYNTMGVASRFFDGSLAGIAIYNRALSPAEVEQNFQVTRSKHEQLGMPDILDLEMTKSEQGQTNKIITLHNYAVPGSYAVGSTATCISPDGWPFNPNPANPSERSSLHFHGDGDYIASPSLGGFTFTTNPWTISMVVQPLTYGGCLLSSGNVNLNGIEISEDDSYKVHLYTMTSEAEHTVLYSGDALIHPPTTNDAVFYEATLIVVACDGTNVTMYFNGKQEGYATNFIQAALSPYTNIVLGTEENAPVTQGEPWLDGDLYFPEIWSRCLTPVEVADLAYHVMQGRHWPDPPQPVLTASSGGSGSITSFDMTSESSGSSRLSSANSKSTATSVMLREITPPPPPVVKKKN